MWAGSVWNGGLTNGGVFMPPASGSTTGTPIGLLLLLTKAS